MSDPRDDLPGLVAGELTDAEAEALASALDADDALRRDLAAVAFADGALRDAASLEFADPSELPALTLPPEALAPQRTAVLLVATDDGADPAYRGARRAAMELARRRAAPARVVLYDRSPELYLVDPYQAATPSGPGLLDEAAARRLGRAYLAEQLGEAAALGLAAGAWVAPAFPPPDGGRPGAARSMADCLAAVAADEVMLPAKLASPGLLDRVRGHTLGAVTAAMTGRRTARVHLADEQGRLVGL